MKVHTKVYMRYFGYQIAEDCICEVCNNGTRAVDVHHIYGRGKGKDVASNLMGLCRAHHDRAHTEKISKSELQQIHYQFMKI